MVNENNQPRKFDAVLGGDSPIITDAVIGGIERIKKRFQSEFIEDRQEALDDALKYGEEGIDVIIQALQDTSGRVRRYACKLLRDRDELKAVESLQKYRPWFYEERLKLPLSLSRHVFASHSSQFANRKVEDFDPQIGISDPVGTAYALRVQKWGDEGIQDKLEALLSDPKIYELEALIFGMWHSDVFETDSSGNIIKFLVDAKDKLCNLKAIFIGDVTDRECMISTMGHTNMSPILQAYPNLEVLKIRGAKSGNLFSPTHHDKLKALIIETGGLAQDILLQIYSLQLPALEHLELWLGSHDYGCNCSVEDLIPILYGNLFPNLVYLGLRNNEFSNEIVNEIITAKILEKIKVLDLSLGTLTDEGAENLLDSPLINKLDILNVSDTYVTGDILYLLWQMDVDVIGNSNRDYDYEDERYCSVTE
jgi:hypothetical protein